MATDPGAFDRLPHQLEHPSARTVLGQLQQPQQPQHHPRPNNGDAPQRQRGPGELALAAVAAAAASAEGVGFGGPSQLRMEAGTPPVKVESRMESRMEDVTPTSVGGIPAAPSPTPTSPASPPGGAPLTPTLGDSRMASVGPGGGSSVGSPGNAYKRASRRGAVKRFTCEYEGCEKVYSRFEHLQRHQLNHNPKQIYRCDVAGCDQQFVRYDLLSRHKKRHNSTYVPRNRYPSFSAPTKQSPGSTPASLASPESAAPPSSASTVRPHQQYPPPPLASMPHDARILLTPESTAAATPASAAPSVTGPPLPPPPPPQSLQQVSHHQQQQQQQQSHPPPGQAHGIHLQHHQQHQPPPPHHHQPHHHHHPHDPHHHPHQHQQPHEQHPHHQPTAAGWPPQAMEEVDINIIRPRSDLFKVDSAGFAEQPPSDMTFANMQFQEGEADGMYRNSNFAMWLFNGTFGEISYARLPFLEGGLESAFNNNIAYDYESSLTSRSQLDVTPPRQVDPGDELINEVRRSAVLERFHAYRTQMPKYEVYLANICHDSGGDVPGLSLEMMQDCLKEYWEHVSSRLPIVHPPTFSPNRCPLHLLLVMLALGAASLRSRDVSGNLSDYGAFADVIIDNARWEIIRLDEARPPVVLWVAQALLLLELYEKMYSGRPLHERAHIYHSTTLTLLRRGSPLIGRSGSESPPDEGQQPGRADDGSATAAEASLDSRTWWTRWAEREAMHRVVFAAFVMDIIHAAMFGHTADMSPHEIRLPLPCEDNLWTAHSPDRVRRMEGNLRMMYGVKPISFLDGLKYALHGKEVKTLPFGHMIIMSGLLSVGWHLMHREANLKWLEFAAPPPETQDKWRNMLLRAFDDWKDSFDNAMGSSDSISSAPGHRSGSNGPIQSASVLYHLAHISLHVDIIDCQVYAGARRLLGRKVSRRDYANVVSRMSAWSTLPATRHAVLHAFRLLHRVLVEPRQKKRSGGFVLVQPPTNAAPITYSVRSDADPHRPWIMYYAALCIWCFVQAQATRPTSSGGGGGGGGVIPPRPPPSAPLTAAGSSSSSISSAATGAPNSAADAAAVAAARAAAAGVDTRVRGAASAAEEAAQERIAVYLSRVAGLEELDERTAQTLYHGLGDLLDVLYGVFDEANSELLREAQQRLRMCKEMLGTREG